MKTVTLIFSGGPHDGAEATISRWLVRCLIASTGWLVVALPGKDHPPSYYSSNGPIDDEVDLVTHIDLSHGLPA